jgi:hypothetical protein
MNKYFTYMKSLNWNLFPSIIDVRGTILYHSDLIDKREPTVKSAEHRDTVVLTCNE